jgi:acyl-CoA thioesterase II
VNATDFLGIERISENQWRLRVTERLITPGQFLFGGCGLAAGVVALEEHSGRPTIWSTAHYLSYAPTHSDVLITSTLAVVGGRVSPARAVATIDDREILTVNAALGTGDLAAEEPWVLMPDVPGPDECPRRRLPKGMGESVFEHIDTRVALGRRFEDIDGSRGSPHTALWARVPGHLDPSAATLAIFGDFVSSGASEPMGQRLMGRSLDNTIRVATLEPTEWVLCDIHMHALSNGFAHGTGFLFSENGTLLATASQSIQAKVWNDLIR